MTRKCAILRKSLVKLLKGFKSRKKKRKRERKGERRKNRKVTNFSKKVTSL